MILEELPDEWINVSRWAKGINLGGYGPGDIVVLEVEVAGNGRRYLQSIRPAETGASE